MSKPASTSVRARKVRVVSCEEVRDLLAKSRNELVRLSELGQDLREQAIGRELSPGVRRIL